MESVSKSNMFLVLAATVYIAGSFMLVPIMSVFTLLHWNIPNWLLIASSQVLLSLPIIFCLLQNRSYKNREFTESLGFTAPGLINIVLGVVLGLLAIPLMGFIGNLTMVIFGDAAQNPVDLGFNTTSDMVMILICSSVLPGLFEEIAFRGFFASGYRKKPFAVAALMNGLVFGMIHMSLYQFFYAFVAGVFLFTLRHFSRSIWPAIVAHFTINFTQVAMSFLLEPAVNSTSHMVEDEGSLALSLAVLLISLAILGVLLTFYIKYNLARNAAKGFNPDIGEKGDENRLVATFVPPYLYKLSTARLKIIPENPFDVPMFIFMAMYVAIGLLDIFSRTQMADMVNYTFNAVSLFKFFG